MKSSIKEPWWRLGVALGLALALGSCAQAGSPEGLVAPSQAVRATEQPLATEAQDTPEARASATLKPAAKAAAKPTPRPTKKAASFYKPPGWDGSSDVDCPDFDTHAHAQSFFVGTHGTKTSDPYKLDRDHDGIACETLP